MKLVREQVWKHVPGQMFILVLDHVRVPVFNLVHCKIYQKMDGQISGQVWGFVYDQVSVQVKTNAKS